MAVGLSSLRGPAPVVGCPHRRLIAMPLRLGSRLVTRAIATPVSPSSRLLPGLLPRTPTPVPAPVSPPPASATPPAAAPASPAQQLWSGYLRSLKWQPMAIKAATSFCCTLLGDSIAQMVGGVPFSAARVLKLSAYSALVGSSTGHAWHAWLDATVMPHAPSSAAAVGMKVLLDQLIFTPVMTCTFFVFLKAGVEANPAAVLPFMQLKLVSTLLAGYAVWPVVNIIMFRFVPRDLRILVGNLVGLGWGIFLSLTCVNGAVGSASSIITMPATTSADATAATAAATSPPPGHLGCASATKRVSAACSA